MYLVGTSKIRNVKRKNIQVLLVQIQYALFMYKCKIWGSLWIIHAASIEWWFEAALKKKKGGGGS
jgi:hypothetical protein